MLHNMGISLFRFNGSLCRNENVASTGGAFIFLVLLLLGGFVEGDVATGGMSQGFVIALAVGLLGGAYPAYRGAHLLPTEALRHE